jgi:predicted permease
MTGFAQAPIQVAERALLPLNQRPFAGLQNVTPGYFVTMHIPLQRGRDLSPHDRVDSPPVTVLSERAARLFWPQYPAGPDPIGQHILLGSHPEHIEIVGIVADVHQAGLDIETDPEFYLPVAQQPPAPGMMAVRTGGDPLSVAGAIRARILGLDPEQPVSDVATMSEVIDESEGQLRTTMILLTCFAGVATLIAVVGLYGFTAYAVEQREKEIGIRRALGADRTNILSLILSQGLRLTLAGAVLGICLAFAANRLLEEMLFHVSRINFLGYLGAPILFLLIAAASSCLAARRAIAIDPWLVIRSAK